MTIEEFEQASEIYRKYDEIEDIIERIKEAREEKLQIDERTKKDGDNHCLLYTSPSPRDCS